MDEMCVFLPSYPSTGGCFIQQAEGIIVIWLLVFLGCRVVDSKEWAGGGKTEFSPHANESLVN